MVGMVLAREEKPEKMYRPLDRTDGRFRLPFRGHPDPKRRTAFMPLGKAESEQEVIMSRNTQNTDPSGALT